jgi:hypothetical protein
MTVDTIQHNQEVKDLWDAFGRKENTRVPITFACDDQVWLKVSGYSFREFYTDPRVQIDAQLKGFSWIRDNIIGDSSTEYPDTWWVGVQHWMMENEFFGCEVVYQDDDYAWAKPLTMGKQDLLRHIADLDPEERVRKNLAYSLYCAMTELADGMQYMDRPVKVGVPLLSYHGIFTKAAEIRGLEDLCMDLYEDPDFAMELLRLVTEKSIARYQAAMKVMVGEEAKLPYEGGFGICDDSLQMISVDQYNRFVLPFHEQLYSTMATGGRSMHLCGPATQHYENLYRKLHIVAIDGPGTFADHGKYLAELGPDFSFSAQANHTTLGFGTKQEIDEMLRKMLTPEAKQAGRFQIMGFLNRHTPLENVQAFYEAGKKYGVIEA